MAQRRHSRSLLRTVATLALLRGCPQAIAADAAVRALLSDMSQPSEVVPHGVPASFGWPVKPLVQAGNDPGGFNRLLPWLQVYEAAGANPATNTRVEVRALRARILSKRQGTWTDAASSRSVTGFLYVETYAGDAHKPADTRPEPDGGLSVVPGGGYCFHAWLDAAAWPDMIAIDPDDIGAVVVTFEARLVVDDPNKPDDRQAARFVASAGADYWTAPLFNANKGVAIGRFHRLTGEWQTLAMTTLTPEQAEAHPPPRP